ncbi:arylsulfatase L-like isoform X1 [Dipodomys spectabilis]|uniref:arylsulfatase L-like isoform X1 n=2 Tax=Dipodomys spectabilis TaxID=105255 RepID=UPI001C548173|nr:arylsulfatase L-like isoform X1 [Dipodomys spectabilis]XP_042546585.1 arylsulfatase L-like isoform X1 [Dipodomys spectabilis]
MGRMRSWVPCWSHSSCAAPPLAFLLLLLPPGPCTGPAPSRPNFLLLLADDLGLGDLGSFGNRSLRTPHLDGLARDGVRLTQHLAAASVCSPSRAAFLTGRYPVRLGMVTTNGARVLQWAAVSGGLPTSEITFAKILQEQGYATGLIGKWHLGLNCESPTDHCHHPLNHGFDSFFGVPFTLMGDCLQAEPSEKRARLQGPLDLGAQLLLLSLLCLAAGKVTGLLGLRWVPWVLGPGCGALLLACTSRLLGIFIVHADCFLMRDHQVVQQPLRFEASAGLFLREAEAFIHRHQARPFLLLVSFLHVHVPLVTSPAFRGRSAHGAYGDNVEELDWMVGRLLAALDGAGLGRRTLVYFTSDHGASLEARAGGARLGGSNGVHRGGKGMGGWEGGIRVPGLVRWPGTLPAGRLVPEPTSLMDLFPTVVRLAGGWVPADREVDGRDLMPALLGTAQAAGHDFLLHYCEARLHAVRWFDRPSHTVWKLHFATPRIDPPGSGTCLGFPACACSGRRMTRHRRPLLFDLTADPGETRPLQGLMAMRRRVEAAVALMLRMRRPLAAPPLAPAHNTWSPRLQPCCSPGPLCACDHLIPDL